MTNALPPRRRRHTRWIVVGVIGVAVVAIAAIVVGQFSRAGAPGAEAPQVGDRFVVPVESAATTAAATSTGVERDAATYLAARPTAYWLTPERDPIGSVGTRVSALAMEARKQDATVSLVIYGLPERDCGNHSAGGLDPDDYPVWIAEIAKALTDAPDVGATVVLEPDSLALATQCGNLDARVPQLRAAVDALQREDTWLYLDGGHSDWHPAAETARLLNEVGTSGVRGFATNVSNFNTASAEFAYAHEVAADAGGDLHAVIDTSRSGAGSTGDWCNPPGRLVGEQPATLGDDVVDTNLWIKPPGESDGPCNGGPAAGAWWPDAAVDLTRAARG